MHSNQISILMPVFNGEQYLKEAIDSVLAQDYPSWELIVADDGSTDATKQIVLAYADQRIRYHYQDNGGQASALNLALKLASGEYVTTLDADDWLPPDSLSVRANYLASHLEFGAVYGNGYYCAEDGEPLARFSDYCLSNITGDLFEHLVVSNLFGTGAAVLIRRDIIVRFDLRYDEQIVWCQDWDFYLRLAEHTMFGYVDTNTVNYRLHGANMTMKLPTKRQQDSIIKTRRRILSSGKFSRLPVEQKAVFFQSFLRVDLRGNSAGQREMLEHPQFQSLPDERKALLVRLVALDHLLAVEDIQLATEWLHMAHSMNPSDRKTALASLLLRINPQLARLVVRFYRKGAENQPKNPYDLDIQSSRTPKATISTDVENQKIK